MALRDHLVWLYYLIVFVVGDVAMSKIQVLDVVSSWEGDQQRVTWDWPPGAAGGRCAEKLA